MDITIRPATEAEWPAVTALDARSFGFHYTEQDRDDARRILDLDRVLVAVDDSTIVGVTADFDLEMTVPGGASLPVPGVTWVSVATTHRRRGVLRALMAEQHRAYLDQGQVASILGASESGIYGRFGYGPASELRRVEVDRRFTQLRPELGESSAVRLVDAAAARETAPAIHERWRRRTPGGIGRTETWWDFLFLDREHRRRGASALFFALHPDGYLSYRVQMQWNEGFPAHEIEVVDLFAATDEAYVDLWRFLLSIDLAGPVRAWEAPPGDPLPFLLDQPRHANTLRVTDGVWVRLLDVAAALAARRYAVPGRLVFEVHDPFLDAGGRFLLDGGPDGATCQPTHEPADLVLGVAALGSMYLGAHSASTLAAARLVEADDQRALSLATWMFAAERPARTGTDF